MERNDPPLTLVVILAFLVLTIGIVFGGALTSGNAVDRANQCPCQCQCQCGGEM